MKSSVISTKVIQIKYVVDTWAWIEYLISSPHGEKVKEIVENDRNEIYINSIILAEVISKTIREEKNPNIAFNALIALSKIVDINDPEFSKSAGNLHAEMRKGKRDFGLSDAFILASARKIGAKVLTGDPHFKNIKEAVMI